MTIRTLSSLALLAAFTAAPIASAASHRLASGPTPGASVDKPAAVPLCGGSGTKNPEGPQPPKEPPKT